MPSVRRGLACASTALIFLPWFAAPAGAAPFGELPFRSVPTAAVCVRATGVPGELIRWTRGGATLMQARADGLRDAGFVRLGTLNDCPAVAADATTGAAVLAGSTKDGIRVAMRAPGGGWGAPERIAAGTLPQLSAGVSRRGDAVIAWVEQGAAGRPAKVRAARHTAGVQGWTVEKLSEGGDDFDGAAAGMAADGEALVAFAVPGRGDDGRIEVVSARPGATLTPARNAGRAHFGADPRIAVAPDGRVLVSGGEDVYERPPGGMLTRVWEGEPDAFALRPDGGAVIVAGSALGVWLHQRRTTET